MTNVLVYVEIVNGKPTDTSLELLAGARVLAAGERVDAAVVSDTQITDLPADTVYQVNTAGADLGGYTAQSHTAGLKAILDTVSPDLLFLANSYVGLDLSASIATLQQWPLMSYCSAIAINDDKAQARCRVYGGKLDAELECSLPAVVAISPGTFDIDSDSGSPEIQVVAIDKNTLGSTRVLSTQENSSVDIDITQLERLVCVGRGIGEEDNIAIAREFADMINAEVVASRPVVDLGWVEKARQVGKSGNAVKPKLYIAVGVSGAPEHLEGMSDAEMIIAINSDPEAPIFDIAHYGTTCDALVLLPELIEKMKQA